MSCIGPCCGEWRSARDWPARRRYPCCNLLSCGRHLKTANVTFKCTLQEVSSDFPFENARILIPGNITSERSVRRNRRFEVKTGIPNRTHEVTIGNRESGENLLLTLVGGLVPNQSHSSTVKSVKRRLRLCRTYTSTADDNRRGGE